MTIHEAVVLRLFVYAAAGRDSRAYSFVDFLAALCRQAHDDFGALCSVTNCIRRKGLEEFFDEQHDEDILAYDHASRILIGKLWIEGVAKLRKKGDGTVEVLDRQIDVDAGRHFISFRDRMADQAFGFSSRTGRTSILPTRAGGILDAT